MAAIDIVECVWKEHYQEAQNHSRKLIKRYPHHPVGYFFYAAVLNTLMEYLESDEFEEELYASCDQAIAKGDALLKKSPSDYWAVFFLAGANGIKGKYESRKDQWVTAFKHGWRGISLLKDLHKGQPGIIDVFYGIALYDYWRSAKTKLLWWMPGVEDRRDESIKLLYTVIDSGLYSRESSIAELTVILCNEKRFEEALDVLELLNKRYPGNYFYLQSKASINIIRQSFREAEEAYLTILRKLEGESFNCQNTKIVCHFALLKIYQHDGTTDRIRREYAVLKELRPAGRLTPKIEKIYEEASQIVGKLP